jgi:adenylate cyclase class 2
MDSPLYEVEQKYPVDDFQQILFQLEERAIVIGDAVEQQDSYYGHPARDFGVTDEALRIRRVGSQSWMTYKGPRVDTSSKTRRELEVDLPPGRSTADQYDQLLQVLGFQQVGDVIKSRRTAVIPWTGWDVVMALDEVVSLGCYVELETICLAGKLKDAEQVIDRIATELGLFSTERASYLELLVGEG